MKIITPKVELVDFIDADEVLKKIERCGRVCYQSEPKGEPEKFVRMLIKRGHESVLEHVSLTFHIICDRAIQNELVRHRLASFSVESTRFCKYDEIEVVAPDLFAQSVVNDFVPSDARWLIKEFCQKLMGDAEDSYQQLIIDYSPELARAVLPLCLKSELYMTANLREWRHILKLRTSKHAHPQMQFIAGKILDIFKEKLPVIVEDIQHD